MRYYLIAGEASGDLHAAGLMKALKEYDKEACFRFYGGDMMAAQGGECVMHYRQLAYMGFVPVLLHLPVILKNMRRCKQDIERWRPHVVILIDYPGFNLSIAKYVKAHTSIPVFYYISPKIWAWKEYRIKAIKRDVSHLFSILPFEVPFFEQKHSYPIHYVGNPTADEVAAFRQSKHDSMCFRKPVIALLAGSRRQEIKDNLPAMIQAVLPFLGEYDAVVAGAPAIEPAYYRRFVKQYPVKVVFGETYPLLEQAQAALVTSGTATLETALFGVPQVVCYKTPLPKLIAFLRRHLLKVKYISLVNLIADDEVVKELVADTFSVKNIRDELQCILPGNEGRKPMLQGYEKVRVQLGDKGAPQRAARLMVQLLQGAAPQQTE